jgi:hypothetical protein
MIKLATDKKTITDQYKKADPSGKKLLNQIFGDKFFLSIPERIKTWEDAAKEYGVDPVESLPYPKPTNNRQEALNAFYMLDIISEILCEGVVLDWEDSDQKKWYPYFNDYTPGSGSRFIGTDYDWANANAAGGARLCVPTSELAGYFGEQFLSIWKQFLNPIK